MKKQIKYLLILGISCYTSSFARVYFGIESGRKTITAETGNQALQRDAETFLKTSKLSASGVPIGVYAGFGTYVNNFYFGGELTGSYNTNKKTYLITVAIPGVGNVASSWEIKNNVTMGLDFIPGYNIHKINTLLYGRLGVGADFIKSGFGSNIVPRIDPYRSMYNDLTRDLNRSIVIPHLRTGIGAEWFITERVSIKYSPLSRPIFN